MEKTNALRTKNRYVLSYFIERGREREREREKERRERKEGVEREGKLT